VFFFVFWGGFGSPRKKKFLRGREKGGGGLVSPQKKGRPRPRKKKRKRKNERVGKGPRGVGFLGGGGGVVRGKKKGQKTVPKIKAGGKTQNKQTNQWCLGGGEKKPKKRWVWGLPHEENQPKTSEQGKKKKGWVFGLAPIFVIPEFCGGPRRKPPGGCCFFVLCVWFKNLGRQEFNPNWEQWINQKKNPPPPFSPCVWGGGEKLKKKGFFFFHPPKKKTQKQPREKGFGLGKPQKKILGAPTFTPHPPKPKKGRVFFPGG